MEPKSYMEEVCSSGDLRTGRFSRHSTYPSQYCVYKKMGIAHLYRAYGNTVSKSGGPKKNLTLAFQTSVGQASTPYGLL